MNGKEADGVKVNDKVWDKVVLNDNISFTMADVTEPAEETTEEPIDATGDAATEDTRTQQEIQQKRVLLIQQMRQDAAT